MELNFRNNREELELHEIAAKKVVSLKVFNTYVYLRYWNYHLHSERIFWSSVKFFSVKIYQRICNVYMDNRFFSFCGRYICFF